MGITRATCYALSILWRLACQADGMSVSLDKIAELGLPRQYIRKLLSRLRAAGLIEGRIGRGNSWSLARSPQEIRLIDVVLAVEENDHFDPLPNYARIGRFTPIAVVELWRRKYLTQCKDLLDKTTLEDVLDMIDPTVFAMSDGQAKIEASAPRLVFTF